jgi:hypothetical protein
MAVARSVSNLSLVFFCTYVHDNGVVTLLLACPSNIAEDPGLFLPKPKRLNVDIGNLLLLRGFVFSQRKDGLIVKCSVHAPTCGAHWKRGTKYCIAYRNLSTPRPKMSGGGVVDVLERQTEQTYPMSTIFL